MIMWFWITMFICNLMIPLLMLGAGYMMDKHPPKKINGVYGYRTGRSMRNMETWNYAHHYCGKLWVKYGAVMLIPTIAVQLPFVKSSENVVGIIATVVIIVQTCALILPVFFTERALRKKFG